LGGQQYGHAKSKTQMCVCVYGGCGGGDGGERCGWGGEDGSKIIGFKTL